MGRIAMVTSECGDDVDRRPVPALCQGLVVLRWKRHTCAMDDGSSGVGAEEGAFDLDELEIGQLGKWLLGNQAIQLEFEGLGLPWTYLPPWLSSSTAQKLAGLKRHTRRGSKP